MKTVILRGGLAPWLREETRALPKPMVGIGVHPIICHIMGIYAATGFPPLLGGLWMQGQDPQKLFLELLPASFRFDRRSRYRACACHWRTTAPDWEVSLVDTGTATETGGHIKKRKKGMSPFPCRFRPLASIPGYPTQEKEWRLTFPLILLPGVGLSAVKGAPFEGGKAKCG